MPPEAIQDSANVSTQSDIYSFGIMFHEMLTGSPVFLKADVLKQHLHEIPAAPSSINPEVPKQLDEIVLRCLEKDPADRFDSFAELEAALVKVAAKFTGAIPDLPEQVLIPERMLWFMKAFTLMEFDRYEEAIDAYKEVLAQDPKDEESYNNMALCLAETRRFEESCKYAIQAVELKPDYVEAWANLGGVLSKLARYDEGIAACDRAIALDPNWAEGHANRGANLTQMGRFGDALACFDRALEADPKYWKAYLMAAEAKARWGESPEEILASVEKALEINPREANGLALASACFNDLGRRREAEHYLELAKSVDPDNSLVHAVEELIHKKQYF
jgi:tetratricopeptide (TPR) repeat protein